MGPNLFRGIKLRGIRWKRIDMEPPVVPAQEGLDILPLMDIPPIPDQDHRPPQMAQQMSQKPDGFQSL